MHEIVIRAGERAYPCRLPAAWAEVRPQRWRRIWHWVVQGDSAYTRTRLLRLLMEHTERGRQIPRHVWRMLDPWQVLRLNELLAWIWGGDMPAAPFDRIRLGGRSFWLPNDRLQYITVIEYAFVDFHFMLYHQAVQAGRAADAHAHLTKVCAYLCRPAGRISPTDAAQWKGDRREQFNQALCDSRVALFERMPEHEKLAVLLFFASAKNRIRQENEGIVFAKPSRTGGEVIGTKPVQPQTWIDLCFRMAGGKFGTLQETMYTPLSTFLYEIRLRKQS